MKVWITKLVLIVLALMILITSTFWISQHVFPLVVLDVGINGTIGVL